MSIWRWADWIDFVPEQARITLGEGNSPLVRAKRIGTQVGLTNLWLKLDFVNPTASYKDRFAAATISHMVAAGKTRCIATSSGNTGASLAAYCAVAGIECLIAIVEGAPLGKLQQMLCYGAKLYRIRGFGADAAISSAVFDLIMRWGSAPDAAVQVSSYKYSAPGMTGVETVSFELAEQSSPPRIDPCTTPSDSRSRASATSSSSQLVCRFASLARAACSPRRV